ncbi:MAG: signal peptidase II [Anaerolineales bacterium]|nr:signal peptidase II [Anaerolineales bacterium]
MNSPEPTTRSERIAWKNRFAGLKERLANTRIDWKARLAGLKEGLVGIHIDWNALGPFLKEHWRDYLFLFPVAGAVVALDQWTKAWVRANIPLGSDWLPETLDWLAVYARLRHWTNTGAAFGVFKEGAVLFMILAIIVAGLIIFFFPLVPRRDWYLRLAMALQMGGALGNLVDRLRFDGHVTDFISIGSFAVFNVADASVTVGVAVLVLGAFIQERQLAKQEKSRQQQASDQEEGTREG